MMMSCAKNAHEQQPTVRCRSRAEEYKKEVWELVSQGSQPCQ